LGELTPTRESEPDSLGLDLEETGVEKGSEIGSMAPDCDDQTLDQ